MISPAYNLKPLYPKLNTLLDTPVLFTGAAISIFLVFYFVAIKVFPLLGRGKKLQATAITLTTANDSFLAH